MNKTKRFRIALYLMFLLFLLGYANPLLAYPVTITDSSGTSHNLTEKPQKLVCLVPSVTEIIFQLGEGKAIKGLTYHDTQPAGANQKVVVGGFFSPSTIEIEALDPDVIIVSSIHQEVRRYFSDRRIKLVEIETSSIKDLYHNVRVLGKIFEKENKADEIIRNIDDNLNLISLKIDKIPQHKRKRVIRLMGMDKVMTPGDDSFQNEFIRAAGGIPPQLGKKGSVVDVTLDEWKRFNPQVIYACGGDKETAKKFFSQPGWKDVEAVQESRIFYFPCDLTCRASVNTGNFVSWLASTIYEEEFASAQNRVLDEKRIRTKPLEIELDSVKSARVDETTIFDFSNKTLIIEFNEPMSISSTLEGNRGGILTVGNHYSPPPCWSITHRLGLDASRNQIYKAIGKSKKNSSFLFTGANMENLSIQKAQFRDMTVYALVTAGVETNAVRMSVDEGRFYEPGTINVIIMTNMMLSPRAMLRAIISATEAKTAAMQDLDVRSSYSHQKAQATGTGTDEVLVVGGRGRLIENAGGHSKMGELIAKAVYAGVKDAVYRQNGITSQRSIFRRLQERHIRPYELVSDCTCLSDQNNKHRMLAGFEEILLQPRYSAFMESALTVSDAFEAGLIKNLDAFEMLCRNVAEEIAGSKTGERGEHLKSKEIPIVIRMSINALLNGVKP